MIRAARSLLEAAAKDTDRASAVVNVSSVAGVMGVGSSVAYAASKGALNTMTLSLARALAPVIRVNAVCPGFVETDWLRAGLGADFAKHKASWEAIAPLKSTLLPDDIAQSVLWLVE